MQSFIWFGEWHLGSVTCKKEMLQLRASDSILPKAYGLPKIHKKNTSFRIIVSSVNTILFLLAKYFNKIISNNISRTQFQVKSFELCDALSNEIIPESEQNMYLLFSLDVIIYKYFIGFDN